MTRASDKSMLHPHYASEQLKKAKTNVTRRTAKVSRCLDFIGHKIESNSKTLPLL